MPDFNEIYNEFIRLKQDENKHQLNEPHPIYTISRGQLSILQLLGYYHKYKNSPGIDKRLDEEKINWLLQVEKGIKNSPQTLKILLGYDRATLDHLGIYELINHQFIYEVDPRMSVLWAQREAEELRKCDTKIPEINAQNLIGLRYIQKIIDYNANIQGSNEQHFIYNFLNDLESDPKKIESLRNSSNLKDYKIEEATKELLKLHDTKITYYVESTKRYVENINNDRNGYGAQKVVGNLTNYEIAGIKLLYLVNSDNPNSKEIVSKLSETQKDFLNEFVTNALGNMDLNKKLQDFMSNKQLMLELFQKDDIHKYGGGFAQSMYKLSAFTFKTRHHAKYKDIAKQFISNINNQTKKIFKSFRRKKITLAQFGILSDIDKVRNILPQDIYGKNAQLKSIFEKAEKIHPTMSSLSSSFANNLANSHSVIATINMGKHAELRGKKLSFMQKLRKWITKHDHTSLVYRKYDGGPLTQSHLNYKVQSDNFDYGQYLYSDMYKLKLKNLISPKNRIELEKRLGQDWEKLICEKYKRIERRLHDSAVTSFDRIKVPSATGFKLRGILSKFKFKTYLWRNDFEKIRADMFDNHTYSVLSGNVEHAEMLCSAFAARTIIATIMQLNKELGSPEEKKDRLIKVPFGINEHLHTLTPDRMIKQLKKYNAIEKIEHNSNLKHFIKI
ncbi:MAG: hypothetical protein HRT87_05005 [Legionellales bacterium]|nr:hypothetical protein [Legionellales bacterium]